MVYVAATLVALLLYCAALWQPQRQLRLHQANLLRAVEKRDWERVATFFADDYSDRWGHDKASVIERAREVFRQFLFVKIRHAITTIDRLNDSASVAASIKIDGSGGPLAQFAEERVDALRDPFVFRWSKQSWKPWDWKLREVNQPELEIPEF
ncbi:MAG TPA: hypothetical protein VFV83_11645 [Chthoniobacteraceae bacterium]|nr:hypothetical protein [Chthoniobacteraceae bacterium]